MDKLKLLILSDDAGYRLSLKEALNFEDISVWGYVSYDENATLKICGIAPDVLVVTYNPDSERMFRICSSVYCSLKGCAIVMIMKNPDVQTVTKAMSNGVRQVLEEGVSERELRECVKKASAFEKSRLSEQERNLSHRCKVISFFGGKGGTGKTTIAVNTAAALAKENKKVLIIDCDLQFGDVNLHFDLEPKETIAELVQDGGSLSIDLIKGVLMLHSSGANVLCAPKSPEQAEYVTASQVESIINIARPYFEYIIIDLPPAFNDISIAAVENSDKVYLVFGMDISSLKNARLCVSIFESLQQKEKAAIIINGTVESVIKAKDFENVLGLPVIGTVCQDTKNAVASLNKGMPMVLSTPKLQMSKHIFAIVRKIKES